MWGHRASDTHPSFVLGLRPMTRPIITCKKDNDDHDNPKNRAEDKLCPQLAKAEVEEE